MPAFTRAAVTQSLRETIRDVPDFPTPGIVFKDITPVLADAALFRRATAALAAPYHKTGITHVVAIESRGFIIGAPVAQSLGASFVPVRKPGKLPRATVREDYALEYGTDALEIHEDAVQPGARVLVVDDLLATGGTAAATVRLVRGLGGTVVGLQFLIELAELNGRAQLTGERIDAVLTY